MRLHYFYFNEKLVAHSVECGRANDCAVILPSEDSKWLSFRNHDRKERLRFVYIDLECILEKRDRRCVENLDQRFAYQHHIQRSA
ncbi:hypothetical protein P5V15_001172 [Pogonomyrmex californicus]